MENNQVLFLFDAYALIYRAYYAFINRPMINSKGVNTSAIYGLTTTLMDVMKREKPAYAAFVFDPPSPTFRHELFSDYKANRLTTPEEIKKSVPLIKDIIQAFAIQVIEVNRYEADDVIGTLAKKAETDGMTTYMVTPDKDYMQLVSDKIKMFKPGRSGGEYELIGIPEVREFFGVDTPAQVIDVLALWGDSSDNIPGAPGIGEKSAKELITRYHTVDNLLDHVDELKPRQKESLVVHRDQVKLSYKLATIKTDVPLSVSWKELLVKQPDEHSVIQIFQQLEFKTLLNRLQVHTEPVPVQQSLFSVPESRSMSISDTLNTIHSVPHHYHLIPPGERMTDLIKKLSELGEFCFDTETTGLNTREASLVGISFCFNAHEAYYISIPAERNDAMNVLMYLKPVFANNSIRKIGQNLKFDMQILMNYGIQVEGALFDTMIAHYLVHPDLKHNLDYMAEVYLNYKMVPIEDLIGKKGPGQRNMRDVDTEKIKEYACEDADITWQLYGLLYQDLNKSRLHELSVKVEMPLIRVLAEMECAGFRIDQNNLREYAATLRNDLQILEASVYEMAGMSFNINSPKQLGEVLFDKMRLADGTQKTKTKQYSTSEDVLSKLTDRHPIIQQILDYRALQKLLSTYVEALPALVDNTTHKVHTSFDQAWVSTGRLSSRNPNLQNIPIRDEQGKEVRKAFVPSDDHHVLLSADYSQIELRLMAHLSGDENMQKAFSNNADIHVSTAAKIFRVEESEVSSSMRSKAKTANFGIIYGISAFGLSQRLNISRAEASDLIHGYFNSFPGAKAYMDHAIRTARERGYVETLMGRRRYLPDINSSNAIVRGVAERNAINAPIQGSAADIIKLAMVNLQARLRGRYKTRLILQVHDELILDVENSELKEIWEMVKYEMEHVVKLSVPLTVDIGTGKNWLEAH